MLWLDEPSYYDPPGKNFLAYTPSIRHELFRPSGVMDLSSHFLAVHLQLVQVRSHRIFGVGTHEVDLSMIWMPL